MLHRYFSAGFEHVSRIFTVEKGQHNKLTNKNFVLGVLLYITSCSCLFSIFVLSMFVCVLPNIMLNTVANIHCVTIQIKILHHHNVPSSHLANDATYTDKCLSVVLIPKKSETNEPRWCCTQVPCGEEICPSPEENWDEKALVRVFIRLNFHLCFSC